MQIKTYVDAIDVIVGLGFLSHGIPLQNGY